MAIEPTSRTQAYTRKQPATLAPFRLAAYGQIQEQQPAQRNAELFYLQKQIQSQTPMVLVLEDGELIEGCIEWYDRNALKIRGCQKTLVYKSSIKYMYKVGDQGQ
jgi:sRNA-binding regulator protein Hfq